MNRFIITASCVILMAGSAFATTVAKPTCATDKTKFQPQAALIEKLKAEGITVSKIKVEKGCYETYATDAKGKKANAAYNAETFEMLDNAEAGEQ